MTILHEKTTCYSTLFYSCFNPPVEICLTDIDEAIVDGKRISESDEDDLSHWWGLLDPVINAAIRRSSPEQVFKQIASYSKPWDGFELQNDGTITWSRALSQTRLWSIASGLLWRYSIPFEIAFEVRTAIPSRFGRFSSVMPDGEHIEVLRALAKVG